eukprot:2189844-Amphidinium_carterae.1
MGWRVHPRMRKRIPFMPCKRADSADSPTSDEANPVDNGRACQFVPRTPCSCHARDIRQVKQAWSGDDSGGHPAQEQL